MTDYLKEGDVGFKKPKVNLTFQPPYVCLLTFLFELSFQTRKKRSTRKQAELSDIVADSGDQMQVDEKPIVRRERNLDDNFVDDDELQAALARSRRAKLQKRKKLSPEELAKKSKWPSIAVISRCC